MVRTARFSALARVGWVPPNAGHLRSFYISVIILAAIVEAVDGDLALSAAEPPQLTCDREALDGLKRRLATIKQKAARFRGVTLSREELNRGAIRYEARFTWWISPRKDHFIELEVEDRESESEIASHIEAGARELGFPQVGPLEVSFERAPLELRPAQPGP